MSSLVFEIPASSLDGVVSRCKDVDHLNKILNAVGVKEFMNLPDGADDLEPIMWDVGFLANDHGFLAIENRAEHHYEFHTAVLPDHRGRDGYKLTRAAAEFMFLQTDCVELHTFVPHDNPNARPPKTFGFKKWFSNKAGTYYRANIFDWARNAPNLVMWGEFFHRANEEAKCALGSTFEIHEDDVNNDRYGGLAIGMMRNGLISKGIWAYNIWAKTAGYHPIEKISDDPVIIFTGDAEILIDGNKMEFVKCL